MNREAVHFGAQGHAGAGLVGGEGCDEPGRGEWAADLDAGEGFETFGDAACGLVLGEAEFRVGMEFVT